MPLNAQAALALENDLVHPNAQMHAVPHLAILISFC
jgi:hypothetical protein